MNIRLRHLTFAVLTALLLTVVSPSRAERPEAVVAENQPTTQKVERPVPPGFALIPGGEFLMGSTLDRKKERPKGNLTVSEALKDARQHKVIISDFLMQVNEVTKAEWDDVRAWGIEHGYNDMPTGKGNAADHPVQTVTWYAVVKWCNAKSEKDALTPCYYTDTAQTQIYRKGNLDLGNTMVKWHANGYRLPTEAEWEKAARGGLSGKRFPWGDTISVHEANFWNVGQETYQTGPTGYPPAYQTGDGIWRIGDDPFTAPVGSFAPNGYGLHDMAGNVCEWCWDWYGAYPTGLETNPRGASTGSPRVVRGGSWLYFALNSRVAMRDHLSPSWADICYGFRVARSSALPANEDAVLLDVKSTNLPKAEPAGSAQPATKPADKVPAKVQPPPPSKDAPQ